MRKVPRKNCHNCPDDQKPEPVKVIPYPREQTPEHGVQLWQQAMFTCNSVIEMMHGYSLIGVAGDKTDQAQHHSEHQLPVRVDDQAISLQPLLLVRGRAVGRPEPVGEPEGPVGAQRGAGAAGPVAGSVTGRRYDQGGVVRRRDRE